MFSRYGTFVFLVNNMFNLSFKACLYPSSPVIIRDFREITIQYNKTRQPAGSISYAFDIELLNHPDYFVPFTQNSFEPNANLTIKNLLIDETIKYRVAYVINGKEAKKEDYSQYQDVSTKKASLAEVSGKSLSNSFFN